MNYFLTENLYFTQWQKKPEFRKNNNLIILWLNYMGKKFSKGQLVIKVIVS